MISIVTWPPPWVRETFIIPKYGEDFGFRLGSVRRSPDSDSVVGGFLAVVPNGRLAEAGVKTGDIPVGDDGDRMGSFFTALEDASDGKEGHFYVVSDFDAWRRNGEARQIVLKPIKRAQ